MRPLPLAKLLGLGNDIGELLLEVEGWKRNNKLL